jgi:hypothetical protein
MPLGLIFLGVGSFLLWRSVQLRMKGLFTIGTVTKVDVWRHRRPRITVSFTTTRNKTIIFTPGGWTGISASPFYQVGSPVPILYDPHNPQNAVVYTNDFMWWLPLCLIVLGLFIIYQGFMH